MPDVLKRLDFGFEVFNRQKRLKFISLSLNNNQPPLNTGVLDSALQGIPGSYTARSGSSLLAIYVQPIVYDESGVSDSSSKSSVIGVVLTAKPLDDVNGTLNTLSRLLVISDLIALLFASLGGWLIAENGLHPITTVTRAAGAIAHNASGANLGTRVAIRAPTTRWACWSPHSTICLPPSSAWRTRSGASWPTPRTSYVPRSPQSKAASISCGARLISPRQSGAPRLRTPTPRPSAWPRWSATCCCWRGWMRHPAAPMAYARPGSTSSCARRREPIQLDELAMDIFRHGRAQLHARNKDLHLSVTNIEPVTVIGDPGQIRQLALILLDNAIKYTPSGGKIRISVTRNGNRAAFSIADTGIGIRAEDRPNIFERFYRADQARDRDEHGSGLGLAIARWIAGAHDGDISVHSQQGQGSTFTVLLPAVAQCGWQDDHQAAGRATHQTRNAHAAYWHRLDLPAGTAGAFGLWATQARLHQTKPSGAAHGRDASHAPTPAPFT